jgi:prepilin-type processing-associated H-X9-DG protein
MITYTPTSYWHMKIGVCDLWYTAKYSSKYLKCPAVQGMDGDSTYGYLNSFTYGYNGTIGSTAVKISKVAKPSETVVLGDNNIKGSGDWNVLYYPGAGASISNLRDSRHGEDINTLWFDGHASTIKLKELFHTTTTPPQAWSYYFYTGKKTY